MAPKVSAGPFAFRFRLPFEPLHSVAVVHQTVVENGVPLTLEQVVAYPSEARVVLRFPAPDGGDGARWQPTDVLFSGKGIERVTVGPVRGWLQPMLGSDDGRRLDGWLDDKSWAGSAFGFVSSSDFMDGGPWTLVVGVLTTSSSIRHSPGGSPTPTPQRVAGPWVFHFTMPPFEPRPAPTPPVIYAPGPGSGSGFPAPPTQPIPQTHEPFPTAPLPGPVETAPVGTVGQTPYPATAAPSVPQPIETVQVIETAQTMYATAQAVSPRDIPIAPPLDGSTAPLQLRDLRKLTLHPELAAANLDVTNPPALSPRGNALLVGTRDHRLLLAKLDGSSPIKLADDVTRYTWSPDGRYVVYLHMEPMGAPSYVQAPYSVTPDGRERHRLDFGSGNIGLFPEVTRDGAWEMERGLWRVPFDGGPAEQVVSMPDATYGNAFRIAPDGKRVAYPCRGGLCLQDMDGSNWRKLDTAPYDMAWSLDGSILAVVSGRDVLFYSREGELLRKVRANVNFDEVTLQWTADSRYLLAYLGSLVRTGKQGFVEIDAATGQVWGGLAPDWAGLFSTSPDGKRLVLRKGAAEFWIADLAAR